MEESLLMQMHENKLLPVVIARPGIVLGVGMSPFHWGVGMWHYGSICQLWGEGNNFLPFVWVEDVVDALIKMGEMPSLEGESFNLVDRPCLTGKEYAEALSMALQTRLEIQPTPIWKFYGYDWGKWIAKTAIQHPGRKMPAWRDWLSRCQYAHYDCMKAITKLSWNPLSERQKLIEEGINKPAREWIK
jgi:nucleoside-diphosphate-sugar epimerase